MLRFGNWGLCDTLSVVGGANNHAEKNDYSHYIANYQRRSRPPPPPPPPRLNPPRPLPLPPPPPPPNERPPPPPERGSCGFASLTVRARPWSSCPLNRSIAVFASSLLLISTNPKPRERPVNLSVMILTEETAPT